MAANIQHADALKLLEHLERSILSNAAYRMTYSDAAQVLGRDPAKDSRHVGQVTSRIDAACFYARTPFLAMYSVRQTHDGAINTRSFQSPLWKPHSVALVDLAASHTWTAEDFRKIRRALSSVGEDAAALLWERIDQFGADGVRKALAAGAPSGGGDRAA